MQNYDEENNKESLENLLENIIASEVSEEIQQGLSDLASDIKTMSEEEFDRWVLESCGWTPEAIEKNLKENSNA